MNKNYLSNYQCTNCKSKNCEMMPNSTKDTCEVLCKDCGIIVKISPKLYDSKYYK